MTEHRIIHKGWYKGKYEIKCSCHVSPLKGDNESATKSSWERHVKNQNTREQKKRWG